MQPVGVADEHDGVTGQGGVLRDPQPDAQEELDGHPDQHAPVGLGRPQQLRCAGVVEGFG